MKARVATIGGYVEVEADSIKNLFEAMAEAQDVFGVRACEKCQESKDMSFQVRRPEGFVYYSIHCNACGAEFRFGQKKEGGALFPKGWADPYHNGDGGM